MRVDTCSKRISLIEYQCLELIFLFTWWIPDFLLCRIIFLLREVVKSLCQITYLQCEWALSGCCFLSVWWLMVATILNSCILSSFDLGIKQQSGILFDFSIIKDYLRRCFLWWSTFLAWLLLRINCLLGTHNRLKDAFRVRWSWLTWSQEHLLLGEYRLIFRTYIELPTGHSTRARA